MKLLNRLVLLASCAISLAGCSLNSTQGTKYSGETGSLVLKIGSMDKVDSVNNSRSIYTSSIPQAKITVSGPNISSSDASYYTKTVDLTNGTYVSTDEETEEEITTVDIDNIPVGYNVVTVQGCTSEGAAVSGLCMRAVAYISASGTEVTVNWTSTALGNVFYSLLSSGYDLTSISDSDYTKIKAATDTTKTNALLVDAASIASDFKSGSLKSKSSYLLTPGTVSFTLYYPVSSFSACLNEPGSSDVTGCSIGEKVTVENCSPGTWTLYLFEESDELLGTNIIGTSANVKVTAGKETELGVISYDGIMVLVDATKYADYKYLYGWNLNGAGTSVSCNGAYPGNKMTQYGNYYIKAFQAASSVSVIANKGSDASDKLYSEDVNISKQGIYLLTDSDPGYTSVTSSGSSGDEGYEDPVTREFDNKLYVNLTDSTWATTETGTYTEITTTKATIGEESNYIKIQFTKDDSSNSTGLIEINAKNTTGSTALYFTGTKTTGGVKVQSNASDDILLYLNGVTMTSSNYPCFEVTKGSKTYVYSSGTNTLTDGRTYGTGYGEEYSTSSTDTYEDDDGTTKTCTLSKSVVSEGSDAKATLFSKGNLILSGSGSLKITESYKNCVGSKGFITVASGTYNLTSNAKNGFDAAYGFTQDGGDITFTGNGAISASTSSSSTSYYVKKANGIVVDGIISSTDNGWIKINGGTYTCTAAYGKGMNAKWSSSEDTDTDGTTGTPDPSVYINGGTISITVTGTGWTGDNTNNKTYYYYDADGVSCHENIKAAAEGIEAASKIVITDGTVEVTAADDGLNESTTGGSITVSGGSLYAYASGGDAVDCNGNIYITGGTIAAFAPTGSEDGLDAGDGYSVTITGGLIASCSGSSNASATASGTYLISGGSSSSSGGMGRPGSSSSSSSSGFSLSSGSTITIYNSSSNLIFTFTMPAASSSSSSSSSSRPGSSSSSGSYSSIIFASPNFTSSGSYTAYTGSSVTGGTSFHGLYTTLPSVSTQGTSTTVTASSSSGSSGGMGW